MYIFKEKRIKIKKQSKRSSNTLENGGNEVLLQPMGIIGSTDTVILCVFYVPSVLVSLVNKKHV